MMRFSPGASVRVYLPNRSMVQSKPCGTVLTPANNVTMTSSTKAMAKMLKPSMEISCWRTAQNANRAVLQHAITHCSAANTLLVAKAGCKVRPAENSGRISDKYLSEPALKFAQHQLTYYIHARLAVVETGDRGKLLAAIVLEDLGVFLRDFLQRLEAVGGETRRHHGDAAHAVLGQLRDGLVGVGLKPLIKTEARLEGQQQLCRIEPHAAAQRFRRRDALRLVGIALVDIFLRHAVERGDDQFGLERQRLQMRVDRNRQRIDVDGVIVIRRRHAQRRLRAHPAEHAEHLVADGCRGRRGILRIERYHQQPVAAL